METVFSWEKDGSATQLIGEKVIRHPKMAESLETQRRASKNLRFAKALIWGREKIPTGLTPEQLKKYLAKRLDE